MISKRQDAYASRSIFKFSAGLTPFKKASLSERENRLLVQEEVFTLEAGEAHLLLHMLSVISSFFPALDVLCTSLKLTFIILGSDFLIALHEVKSWFPSVVEFSEIFQHG